MEPIFNLEEIRRQLDNENWIEGSDTLYRSIYLGSIFNIIPSGKMYTVFSNRNLDACSTCDGDGVVFHKICSNCGGHGSKEVYEDSLWYEQAKKELDSIDCFIENGECDPCDLYVTEYKSY